MQIAFSYCLKAIKVIKLKYTIHLDALYFSEFACATLKSYPLIFSDAENQQRTDDGDGLNMFGYRS